MTKKLLLAFLLTAIFISSCTLEKRRYFKGYHVEWLGKSHKADHGSDIKSDQVEITENSIQENSAEESSLTTEEQYAAVTENVPVEREEKSLPTVKENNEKKGKLISNFHKQQTVSASVTADPDYNTEVTARPGKFNVLVLLAWISFAAIFIPGIGALSLLAWTISLVLSILAAVQFAEGDTRMGKYANIVLLVLHGILILLLLYYILVLSVFL